MKPEELLNKISAFHNQAIHIGWVDNFYDYFFIPGLFGRPFNHRGL